jgi:hypothetical protein
MPDRYWVGGTAAWDGTAGTKWAATSGGAGGESVPTTSDDVFFDANSSGTVTVSVGNTGAKSINCTGFTGTIAGTAAITVAGSVTLDAGQTYTHTGTMTFTGTGTLTTAGKTFSVVVVNGSGITLTLGDAFNSTRSFDVNQGTFDTANYNLTSGSFRSFASTDVRAINLGTSTVTTVINGINFRFENTANLTFNAGISQINIDGASSTFTGGDQTFHNVSFISTGAGARSITGANTFNNLTLNASAAGLSQLQLSADQTVNGTFTCAGSSAVQRGFVRSNTIGTTRTITVAAVSADDCDFRDITIAGAAAPISPTRAGDCGGNSGVTFPAPKTVYRVGTNTPWQASDGWALTSGGAGAANNFPLAQDTAIIDDNTALTGTLALGGVWNIGALDASTRTTGITLNHNAAATRYGSYTLGSGVTVSGTSAQTFSGRGTMVFTSAGKTITFPITVDTPSGIFQLGDAFSSSNSIRLPRGTLSADVYNVTCTVLNLTERNTKVLNMGSGLWTLTGTGDVLLASFTSGGWLTVNKGSADILLSSNSTDERTVFFDEVASGVPHLFNKLTIGGSETSTTRIGGFGSGDVLSFTELASIKTVAHTVRLQRNQGNLGTIDTWSITGSAGNVVTLDTSAAGTRRTFSLTNVTEGIDFLNVRDIGVNQPDRFYVGANSTDSGNNLNVIFTDPPGVAATGNFFMLFN